MKRLVLICTCICVFLLPPFARAGLQGIERVEPPHWWTGFKETGL